MRTKPSEALMLRAAIVAAGGTLNISASDYYEAERLMRDGEPLRTEQSDHPPQITMRFKNNRATERKGLLGLFDAMKDPEKARAERLLVAGHSVAAIVPDDSHKVGWFLLGDQEIKVFDGDLSEVRCEPPGSLILFRRTSVDQNTRPHLIKQLQASFAGGA